MEGLTDKQKKFQESDYYKIHQAEFFLREKKWGDWIDNQIPGLNFKEEWNVRVIPPFAGAVARFTVWNSTRQVCSVYLDVDNSLGSMDGPYWEMYPDSGGYDTIRFYIHETKELLAEIDKAFREGPRSDKPSDREREFQSKKDSCI